MKPLWQLGRPSPRGLFANVLSPMRPGQSIRAVTEDAFFPPGIRRSGQFRKSETPNDLTQSVITVTIASSAEGAANYIWLAGNASGTNTDPAPGTPVGWERIGWNTDGTGPSHWGWLYRRVFVAGDPSTVAITFAVPTNAVAVSWAYEGIDPSTPERAVSVGIQTGTATAKDTDSITSLGSWIVSGQSDRNGGGYTGFSDTHLVEMRHSSSAAVWIQDTNGNVPAGTQQRTMNGPSTGAGVDFIFELVPAGTASTTSVSIDMTTTWNVAAVVTASASTLWNVLVAGLTTVTATLSTSWNVRAVASTARSTLWNVRSSVSASRSTSWNVRALATAARTTSWNVGAIVAAARSTSWNARQAITTARSSLWNVAATIAASRSTSWNIRSVIAAARTTTWNVRARISSAVTTSWNARALVSASRSTLWNVLGSLLQVVSARTTSWNVLTSTTRPYSTSWRVRAWATQTRSTAWNVRALVSSTRSTSWSVRSALTALRSTSWHVLQSVGTTRSTSWNVRAFVGAARQTAWNVAATVSTSWSTLWDALDRNTFKPSIRAGLKLVLASKPGAKLTLPPRTSATLALDTTSGARLTIVNTARARLTLDSHDAIIEP